MQAKAKGKAIPDYFWPEKASRCWRGDGRTESWGQLRISLRVTTLHSSTTLYSGALFLQRVLILWIISFVPYGPGWPYTVWAD